MGGKGFTQVEPQVEPVRDPGLVHAGWQPEALLGKGLVLGKKTIRKDYTNESKF